MNRLHNIVASTLFLVCATGIAQPVTAQQFKNSAAIIDALLEHNTGPVVRSWTSQRKRGINIQGQLPPEVDLPSVSLTINFELGSASLTTDGMIGLRSLAKALLDPRLSGKTFQIAGHTDGRGDAAFNMKLSNDRARTVVEHLTTFYEVPQSSLIPVGWGMQKPLTPNDLMNPLNRRVEIINIAPLS